MEESVSSVSLRTIIPKNYTSFYCISNLLSIKPTPNFKIDANFCLQICLMVKFYPPRYQVKCVTNCVQNLKYVPKKHNEFAVEKGSGIAEMEEECRRYGGQGGRDLPNGCLCPPFRYTQHTFLVHHEASRQHPMIQKGIIMFKHNSCLKFS